MSEGGKERTGLESGMRLFVGSETEFPFIAGRREFLMWRDLGVREPSNGFMRADIISKCPGMVTGTGWHYHPAPCIGQFFYIFSGWAELEFETGVRYRLKEGDAGFIPGGMKHAQVGMSEDYKAMEISFPAEIDTISCERPEHLPADLPCR